ncbi:MAG: hypothetical protein DSY77_16675 [Bacteroidetes bacterium]|nr:MAG: hypothetical protein DSY77_16675 [Bacteroidota bacterium]
MKNNTFYLLIGSFLFFSSCASEDFSPADESYSDESQGNGQGDQSGIITAGEWNDLDNWTFWNGLLSGQDYSEIPEYWKFYHNNRISILLNSNNQPLINAEVLLLRNGETVWSSRTDNHGRAELWIDLFQPNESVNMEDYSLAVNGQEIDVVLTQYNEGINEIEFNTNSSPQNRVELAFIVDATGSMGDELEFLKDDLENVIERVENSNSTLDIYTSSIFYRDEGDAYVVKESGFSGNISTTLEFINHQNAAGGGDFPEAVHTALNKGINELQWSEQARTRIAFLILDAPPHYKSEVIVQLQNSIEEAAKKGIKIIPITASGIDKKTEFLMRFFSLSTNGTYVFITDDSGVGNDHLEPSVGEYQVEFLNDLMVRLIKKYSE